MGADAIITAAMNRSICDSSSADVLVLTNPPQAYRGSEIEVSRTCNTEEAEHKAHLPGRDTNHDNDKPVSNENQLRWPGQVQRPVRRPRPAAQENSSACSAAATNRAISSS